MKLKHPDGNRDAFLLQRRPVNFQEAHLPVKQPVKKTP
jgi:hypothetical protein